MRFITHPAICAAVLLLTHCKDKPAPTTEQTDHRARVHALCKKLAFDDPEPLAEGEMEQFRAGIAALGYDDVLESSRLIEPDPESNRITPEILPGAARDTSPEPWEIPARLIASRLLELAPVHTSRYIQASELGHHILSDIGFRCGCEFVIMFGSKRPGLAWQETQRHYGKYWNIFDPDYRSNIPSMATSTFRGLWKHDPELAKRLLLEKNYQDQPWAKLLQQDALRGILLAIEHDPAQLEQLIAWLEDGGFALPHELSRHSFRINLAPLKSVDLMALALLARIDPQRAIAFAKKHDNPRLADWYYAVYAGWIEFWPYSQRAMERYFTRREDAMTWLAQNAPGDRGQTHVHNAFWEWRSDDYEAAIRWLGSPTQHPMEKDRKAYLVKEFYGEP